MTEYIYPYQHFVGLSRKRIKNNPTYRSIQRADKNKTKFSKLECLECGKDFVYLIGHITQIHGLEYYKQKHHILDNRKLYPPDYLVKVQSMAQKAGITEEAVEARTKFWKDDSNVRDKSMWMKQEMQRRMKVDRKKYIERMTHGAVEHAKKVHEEKKREFLSKKCIVCGGPMKINYINTTRNGLRISYRRNTCSEVCRKTALKGRRFTEEHLKNMALGQFRKAKFPNPVLIDNKVRYSKKCMNCGKEFFVPGWKFRGIHEKNNCSLSCAGQHRYLKFGNQYNAR